MKSLKTQFIGAIAMVLVAAIAMGSSTYAWFAMNTQVTAQTMQVKAVAEDGIVIANADKTGWSNTATAKTTTASLVPTSTFAATTPTFYHNTSLDADQALPNQVSTSYENITSSLKYTYSTHGEGFIDLDGGTANTKDTNEKAYVLLNEFYIKSSGGALTLGSGNTYADLYINKVMVSSPSSYNKIDNALRVMVVVGSSAYIYAPVKDQASGTTTMTYNVGGYTLSGETQTFAHSVTALDATSTTSYNQTTGTSTISNSDSTAVKAQVYVYFEGEDANCKSTNISGITTENLNVSVQFGITPIPTT